MLIQAFCINKSRLYYILLERINIFYSILYYYDRRRELKEKNSILTIFYFKERKSYCKVFIVNN